jgi:hypothetical protein
MSEEDLHAPQANHAEEVLHLVLPADHQPTKVTEPSEKSQTAAYGGLVAGSLAREKAEFR